MQKRISTVLALALGLTAQVVKADFTFGTPTNLGPRFNSTRGEFVDCISSDGLEIYGETLNWPGGYGEWDLWVARRATIDDDWGAPENLGPPVNSPSYEVCAYISADGLSLYFGSGRPDGYGGSDLWVTKRPTKDDDWGPPENLGPVVNSAAMENGSWISPDGLELYFDSNREGGFGSVDIWITKRATKDDPWGEPTNLGPPVNSSASEVYPFVSPDGLLLLFSDVINGPIRPGGFGDVDMWMARRASVNDPWGFPVNMGAMVNSPSIDTGPRISPDGSTLYFSSERPDGLGGHYGDIYQSPIKPVVDLNRDGKVDSADVCFMVDYWGTDEPLFDIGPMPWGDGVVDVQDLIVLAEHLFTYPGAVACWKLDETEGAVAHDSVGNYDGTLTGDPVWQPGAGMVAGALEFDGVDDYASIDPVLNPADGPFSVVAWIKGGAAGQVILSQVDGVSWLRVDSVDRCLLTELKRTGRSASALRSQTNITDGTWHEVGLVWDGSYRCLYVDGVEVARDATALPAMEGSEGGLYLGVGNSLAPGTFFSGLIDDVRVYDRAVRP